jgi:KaiC/GvpD/RAD55 family RecA-like ATPase
MSQMFDNERDTFYAILHAMLRSTPATEQENDRAREVVKWTAEHRSAISCVLDLDEKKVFEHVVVYWSKLKQAPSRQTLEELIRQDDMPEPYLALLDDYDKWQPQLKTRDFIEVDSLVRDRTLCWNKQYFQFVTQNARTIADSGLESGNYKDPMLKGVPDAINYLLKEFHSEVFQPAGEGAGGSMFELADRVMEVYERIEEEREAGTLMIPTGIPVIDDAMGGLIRRTLNLVLGNAGERKSATVRTAAYWAALSGHRVLFVPLESALEEELSTFSMMHAHNFSFEGAELFSIGRFRDGLFNEAEKQAMRDVLVPALKQELGTNLVIRSVEDKSWANIRQLIEAENVNGQLDMVVIDYIALFDLSMERGDKTFAMHQAVRELKQLALHMNDDRGVVVLSPVQGSRKGYDEAVANQGVWEQNGIWMYSEMGKSADNILYTFMPPDMMAVNKMKLGFCKTRRHGPIAPVLVEVDPQVSIVGGSPIVMAARAARDQEMAAYITDQPATPKGPGTGPTLIKGKRKPKPASDGSLSAAAVRRLIKQHGR